ncbi:MAG: glycosyltransferase family 2 protein [Candidatus Doudnabacteria bacterium]|nr:glycosyltransferase family 2 protein [Candidatus Doudnabacteria bacterium]
MSSAKISINILTKNRSAELWQAILSVEQQSFKDYEIVVVDDGSTDNTKEILENLKAEKFKNLKIITHAKSIGITASRQEALLASTGEYVAYLDDDDEWIDKDKLKKQVAYLDSHKEAVLCGGGIKVKLGIRNYKLRIRPQEDKNIRRTMLLRNNFFTSTVMFRREAAIEAGGFVKDEDDFAEDYDLWLRMGKLGDMHNFQEAFTLYRLPNYNKARFKAFLNKQARLIAHNRSSYPGYWLAKAILEIRVLFN